jgi:TetR/AcrR family transcriptional regulator
MGITERKVREKEQRRQEIIDAAEKVIFSKGYVLSTMDDVAEAAELSKGTIYLYYKTKEELYYAITLRGLKILTDLFQRAFEQGENGLDKTFFIGRAFLRFSIDHPNYFHALGYYELKVPDCSDADSIVCKCDDEGSESLNILIRALKIGFEDGSIRPGLDPVKTALLMWGQTSGVIQLMSLKGEHFQKRYGIDLSTIFDDAFQMARCILEKK